MLVAPLKGIVREMMGPLALTQNVRRCPRRAIGNPRVQQQIELRVPMRLIALRSKGFVTGASWEFSEITQAVVLSRTALPTANVVALPILITHIEGFVLRGAVQPVVTVATAVAAPATP